MLRAFGVGTLKVADTEVLPQKHTYNCQMMWPSQISELSDKESLKAKPDQQ
jgi:hypothetical protein